MYCKAKQFLSAVTFLTISMWTVPQKTLGGETASARLPDGVNAVWEMEKAHSTATKTKERVCINGLWRWQPAREDAQAVPGGQWGFFKVPGCWPGISDYMQKDCQTAFPHPAWKDKALGGVTTAWYQREIVVPGRWTGRSITLRAEYVNSLAVVYIDGEKAGTLRYPGGELDLTEKCRPGRSCLLSILVAALPLEGVMLSYNDTASARKVRGRVKRRGLCGDVHLLGTPVNERIGDVHVIPSVRNGSIRFDTSLEGLAEDAEYMLKATVTAQGSAPREFTSGSFTKKRLTGGRFQFTRRWKPGALWDIHTPENRCELHLSLYTSDGKLLDAGFPVRFGFREFWIEGRDFFLNGSRIFLTAVPLDNAQVGAAWATYKGARESMERLQSIGINFVYTHNYGCEPGSHLGFAEILKAADDTGMLVAFSMPHFGHYRWDGPRADAENGYARHAEFYVRAAQNHPSVIAYAASHNATGYAEDMNPHLIDGVNAPRSEWSAGNVKRALRAEAIVKHLDAGRIFYHHSSGNLGAMHTTNFYANFAPIQEMADWFEHWATEGKKPLFTCEYSVPLSWDWTMYRGWYRGRRAFGSAEVPWELCVAEWNAQFLGARAYRISEQEKVNLRWEAGRFRSGGLWHRWDYPFPVGSRDLRERYPVFAMYFRDTWPAFRTWGVSAISPWNHGHYWTLRKGVDRSRKNLKVDWGDLQRPGFSPDFIDDRYEKIELAFDRTDWMPTVAARTLLRCNGPLLAYIAGKPGEFTGKGHNFSPGETVEKQLIIINNSRETVKARCRWIMNLQKRIEGTDEVTVATGRQERIALRFTLPENAPSGRYELHAEAAFSTGEVQKDVFSIDILKPPPPLALNSRIALYDPKGETATCMDALNISYRTVGAAWNPSAYDVLIVGKKALTVKAPAPDITSVRAGLRVIIFEQTPDVLEKRFGFRTATYGLRRVFERVADHPVLTGIENRHLHDWRGDATIVPARLKYTLSPQFNYAPTVKWCGIPVSRLWRCGTRGSVATALIEKPACGDFLPLLDGGYSLQYSPLMEYREGRGVILFCQMDVTGRTGHDPAAGILVRNMCAYIKSWKPKQHRTAVYAGDPAGRRHLQRAGIPLRSYARGELTVDRVLVVGPGGGELLARDATSVADWLESNGRMLLLGLGAEEADSFLPMKIPMRKTEHIAAFFEPFSTDSLFAGVAAADVYNAAPRTLPLLTGDSAVGNGVLGRIDDAEVIFCQLPPFSVSRAQGAVPSFAVTGDDALNGGKSALLNMGTAAWGQFGQKVPAGAVGDTYTFSVFVKSVTEPVRIRLEVERAGKPWDRAARGDDVRCPTDAWTEVHVTFTVKKKYPEGWSAYIYCAQEGARLKVDGFSLYKGNFVAGKNTALKRGKPSQENLFENPDFESGNDPWSFTVRTEQRNLRRTYRRTSFLLTRLLANLGVSGGTPLLERFSHPVGGAAGPSVVRNGAFSMHTEKTTPADGWSFTAGSGQASCVRKRTQTDSEAYALVMTNPSTAGKKPTSAMLAQHNVPVEKDRWYRISFNARTGKIPLDRATVTITNTATWRSFFEYQRFRPAPRWKRFSFEVVSNATAGEDTRFQVWFTGPGTLWISDIAVTPIKDPAEGRWRDGLYLDTPERWDDPYRFFRW